MKAKFSVIYQCKFQWQVLVLNKALVFTNNISEDQKCRQIVSER